jgi:hypothetical protein
MHALPTFPRTRRLAITDRAAIEALTRCFLPYSDFLFTSLWAWDTEEACAIARLNGNLVVRFTDYAGGAPFYSLVGEGAVVESALTLLARARREGLAARLQLIPEVVIAADERLSSRLSVTPDRDQFDYVYALADWAGLTGEGFARHRRQVARCRRHGGLAFRSLDLRDRAVQRAVVGLFDRWAALKPNQDGVALEQERTALTRTFALADGGRLAAGGLVAGERLVAFSIWEGLPGSPYAVAHFRKTDRSLEGLAATLRHEESRLLLARGYRLMNVEQDLGIGGLRAYKESLRPVRFLRKFVVTE